MSRFVSPAVSIGLAILLSPLPSNAATIGLPVSATLAVVGHAEGRHAADRAIIHAEILTSDESAGAARQKNDEISEKVLTALTGIGVPQSAVRTINFQSSFVPHAKDAPPDAPRGYVAQREIAVTVTPDAIDAVTHALHSAGVDQINGISTDLQQRAKAYEEILASAVDDAQMQARVVAHAAHVRLVRITTIDVGSEPEFTPRVYMAMKAAAAPAPAAADVQLSATVNVTYEIAPL